jgi:guanosine-3',5'-bis(diphosphate) 3'-pyrophosphohydrolase
MEGSWESTYRPLLEAASFAARAHQHQLRKDGETPYASHPFRVCLVVRDLFGVDDHQVLMAALLHDTVEDTKTDFDDIEEQFGADVARWVAMLSKDKRLQEPEREKAYTAQLTDAPWQVKVCKLGDIFDNLLDTGKTRPDQQAKTFKNAHRYLDALKHNLPDQAKRSWHIVSELLATVEAGETGRAGGS